MTKPTRAQAARKKTAIAAAKKLYAACDAVHACAMACIDCDDASAPRGADDGRILLQQSMREFASHLESVFDKE